MMPLGATSIPKYGSLIRPDPQIVALRAHCARTARALRLRLPLIPGRHRSNAKLFIRGWRATARGLCAVEVDERSK